MSFFFAPQMPSWATHICHDLTAFKRWPLPVEQFQPVPLPAEAYFEYAFRDASGEWRPDPVNSEAHSPWYGFARSLFGPAYAPSPFNLGGRAEREPRGELVRGRLESRALGQRRRYLVYTPPGVAAQQPLPNVYVQDGLGFLHFGHLPQVLDALLDVQRVPPARLILLPPHKREREYAHNAAYQRFVLDELLPHLERDVAPCTGERVAMGASLGGLVSMLLAWRRPDVFGTVASLSGAFLTAPEAPREHHLGRDWLREQMHAQPASRRLRVVLFAGSLEWLTGANRRLARTLAEHGHDVHHREFHAGHNWVNWRNALAPVLEQALAPA